MGPVIDVVQRRKHVPFPGYPIRLSADICQDDCHCVPACLPSPAWQCYLPGSFSKSFSLTGERVALLTMVVTRSKDKSSMVMSQSKRVIRATNTPTQPDPTGQVVANVIERFRALLRVGERSWANVGGPHPPDAGQDAG